MFSRKLSVAVLFALSLPLSLTAQAGPPDLSDAEVAHVAVTANTIDAELGALAESRARSAEVKRFAAMMKRDHTAVNERAAALARKLGVTPKDNAVSQSLLAGAKEARAKVDPLEGAEFDRAYIEREVAYHQAVLEALDGVLIPTTENAELKGLLVEVRPAFTAHLAYAKQVGEKIHALK
jgi:putative membrane protein